jgi:predicted nucleotidyltransferase
MATIQRLPIDEAVLAAFCRTWKIVKLELFGSFLNGEAGPESDIDLLVTYESGARWSLLEHVHIENELSDLVGRKIDLVNRQAIEAGHNAIRRNAILGTAVPIYVAT